MQWGSRFQPESMRAIFDLLLVGLFTPSALSGLPALVLGGAEDRIISPTDVQETAERFGVEGLILPDLGHMMMLDQGWQDVAETMANWLQTQWPAPAPAPAAAPKAAAPAKPMGPNDYMVIGLARIDDRLIHGQVATRWTKETNVTRIIVVSDEVAADTVRKTLLTQVAPPGVTAHVVDVAKMIRVYNNPKYAGQRVMLLFTNPTDVERIVEGGVKITSVNIGGMAFRQGKTQVNNAISVDAKDIEAFKKLNARGIELEARKVSTDPKLKMMDLIAKVDK